MAADFLVVGLGNPGEEYKFTPHNLGFLVTGQLAERNSIRISRKENMSLVGVGTVAGKPVAVAQPQTFMNVNGPAVKALLERYGISPERYGENLIVVYDELDLPWGTLRIRNSGSAAGHNGVKSLIGNLGTDRFIRVRIGIRPETPYGDGAKYVLGKFKRAQMQEVEEMVLRSTEAVETIIAEGAAKAMAKFNESPRPRLKNEEE
ncbi:MAG: aminoacyl-tRNA hydrolase [Acidobacteriota bacterium]